jgi:hypothetical protein
MQVFYFIASLVGGFFVVAIPWSGLLLILGKRPHANDSQAPNPPAKQ